MNHKAVGMAVRYMSGSSRGTGGTVKNGIFDHFILFEVNKHKPEAMKYEIDKWNILILRLEQAASVSNFNNEVLSYQIQQALLEIMCKPLNS